MKVLHVIPGKRDTPAGMGFVKRQIPALACHGIESSSYFLDVGRRPPAIVRSYRDLRRIIRKTSPDLVHAHFGTITGFLVVLASDRPVVIDYRGSDLNPDPTVSHLRSALQKLLSQLAALGAERIICVSRQLVDRLWWRRHSARIVPSGVDFVLFQPIEQAAARSQLAWAHDEPVVFFNVSGAAQIANKRLDLAQGAVDVASTILGRLVRLHVVYGDTVPAKIAMMLSAADCLIMSSDYEGSPNIVKESMACNLPVVAVDVGDVTEMLAGVEPSYVCARDPHALGAAVAEVIRSGKRSNGRKKAPEISREVLAVKIVDVYRECLPSAVIETAGQPPPE